MAKPWQLRLAWLTPHMKTDSYPRTTFDSSGKPGTAPKVYRGLSTWAILVASKFAMLGAIDFTFGDRVLFLGAFHGVVAFVVVIIAIILAEEIVRRIYFALDDDGEVVPDPA